MASERIILMCKYPTPGEVKTRLIEILGAEGAAALQRQMAVHVFRWMRWAGTRRGAEVEIRYTGGDRDGFAEIFVGADRFTPQGEGDLGARMRRASEEAFGEGVRRVVIVGSDCPTVDEAVIDEAFAALLENEVVLGPATDGGYYLIGLAQPRRDIFEDIPWSTAAVLETTVSRLNDAGVAGRLLAVASDVDRAEDLPVWERSSKLTPPA